MKLIITILLALLTAPAACGLDLDSLLRQSVGGDAAVDVLRDVRTVRTTGTIVLNGEAGVFAQYYQAPDKYYIEVVFSNFSLVQGYDGKIAWQQDLNGGLSELSGFARRELLWTVYFESHGYLFDEDQKIKKTYLGVSELPTGFFHEVAFYSNEADTVRCYFDVLSGLRRQMLTPIDQLVASSIFDDFRTVSGVLVPFSTTLIVEEAGLLTEFLADSIELNGAIPDMVFTMPSAARHDYHFPDSVVQVTIPFEYAGGQIRIPVTINGRRTVWVILDSGASANILHSRTVADLALPQVGSLPAMGMAGYEQVALVQTDSIQIGELTLYEQVAGSMDMSLLSGRLDQKNLFGGIVGYDFLSRFPMLINFEASTVTVFNPETYEPPPGGSEIAFHLTLLVPTVHGEIVGVGGDFIVDLGNALGLVLHHDFVTEHRLGEKLEAVGDNEIGLGGLGGVLAGRKALAGSFRMGDVVIDSLVVVMPDSAMGIAGSQELAGNIGIRVLENYRVLLDYRNSRLILYDTERTTER